jgi:hypothetical protein
MIPTRQAKTGTTADGSGVPTVDATAVAEYGWLKLTPVNPEMGVPLPNGSPSYQSAVTVKSPEFTGPDRRHH